MSTKDDRGYSKDKRNRLPAFDERIGSLSKRVYRIADEVDEIALILEEIEDTSRIIERLISDTESSITISRTKDNQMWYRVLYQPYEWTCSPRVSFSRPTLREAVLKIAEYCDKRNISGASEENSRNVQQGCCDDDNSLYLRNCWNCGKQEFFYQKIPPASVCSVCGISVYKPIKVTASIPKDYKE